MKLKPFLIILGILILFVFLKCEDNISNNVSSINVSQDVIEALSYYPLQVGNKWIYASYHSEPNSHFFNLCNNEYYYLTFIEVIKDTVMSNGKRYHKIRTHYEGLNKPSHFPQEIIDWQRVDSSEGKVYRYDPEVTNQEYLIDNLTAEVNQKIDTHRYETHPSFWIPNPTTCENIEDIQIFNQTKTAKYFIEQYVFQKDEYRLVEDLGLLYHSSTNEYTATEENIKGCIINNTIFGDTRLIVEHEPPRILTLISPNGGEVWQAGSYQDIIWTQANICGVKIDFSPDNGQSWELVGSWGYYGIPYDWVVPSVTSDSCLIRITADFPRKVVDISDQLFSIQ